jgi:peroxiredoxin
MVELSLCLVLGRVVLAGVLAFAGAAKLLDGDGARASVIEFGIPAPAAPAVALALPAFELLLAIALLPDSTAVWSSAAATVLLAVFLGLVAMNLARGKRPRCRCFGELSSGPVGRETLMRNAVLTGLAAAAFWGTLIEPNALAGSVGLLAPIQWIGLASFAVLCVFGIHAWATLQLIAQQGRLLLRIEALEAGLRDSPSASHARQSGASSNHKQSAPVPRFGLPIGSRAPEFRLRGLDGRTRTLADLLMPDRQLFLAFMDPGCGPCTALLPQIARWQQRYAQTLKVAVISRGDHAANFAHAQQYGLSDILLQDDYEVAEAYRSSGTPGAVLIGGNGLIASHVAPGAEAIAALINSAIAYQAPATRSPAPQPLSSTLGEPAPSLVLPDLDGRVVSLADFRGQPTLVVFWNPSCGFCKSALPDLRAWAEGRDQDEVALLVVSTGTSETNRAMLIPGHVVLDPGADGMRAFGAGGTPMAVLVDAEGNIASGVAAGKDGVLALARRCQSNGVAVPLVLADGAAAND